jgi:uncharacterized protein involved in exopolysaccharide biosynthesis
MRNRKNMRWNLAAAWCLALFAVACASAQQPPATTAPSPSGYVLGPDDQIVIRALEGLDPADKPVLIGTNVNSLGLLAGVLLTLPQTPVYQARTRLEIQNLADLDLSAKLVSDNERSRFSAWRKALHLPESKPAPAGEEILAVVADNLKVRAPANTRLVEILYDSTDPRVAAGVANALTAAFIQQNLESHWKTTQQTGEWLTRQMEDNLEIVAQ